MQKTSNFFAQSVDNDNEKWLTVYKAHLASHNDIHERAFFSTGKTVAWTKVW